MHFCLSPVLITTGIAVSHQKHKNNVTINECVSSHQKRNTLQYRTVVRVVKSSDSCVSKQKSR